MRSRWAGKTVPLTGMVPPEVLIDGAKNTIVYEQEAGLREHLFKLFATNHSPSSQASTLRNCSAACRRC